MIKVQFSDTNEIVEIDSCHVDSVGNLICLKDDKYIRAIPAETFELITLVKIYDL